MNAEVLIGRLERFAEALPAVVADLPHDEARFKPPDGAWSILEIVRHLADEEVDDFRTRLRSTLGDPAAEWPPIDPEGWALERYYNEGRLADAIERFVTERRRSIEWLRSLGNPDWSITHDHPQIGPIRAGDLLAAWCAHDALHLRQIAKRLYQLTDRDAGEFNVSYAGTWRA